LKKLCGNIIWIKVSNCGPPEQLGLIKQRGRRVFWSTSVIWEEDPAIKAERRKRKDDDILLKSLK